MNKEKFEDLLYQTLETEMGGVELYKAALRCVQDDALRQEWEKYLAETVRHVEVATGLVTAAGLEPGAMTPTRTLIRQHALHLVQAMESARAKDPEAAQVFACECIVTGETKDHENWSLLDIASESVRPEKLKTALREAIAEVEDQEDEHLYHTQGWARELAIQALGLKAVIPPPEERHDVHTAIGAARAKAGRDRESNR